jgi:hypothetical protein
LEQKCGDTTECMTAPPAGRACIHGILPDSSRFFTGFAKKLREKISNKKLIDAISSAAHQADSKDPDGMRRAGWQGHESRQ